MKACQELQIEYHSEVHICKRNCGSSVTYINHTLMSIFGGKCVFVNIAKIHNFTDLGINIMLQMTQPDLIHKLVVTKTTSTSNAHVVVVMRW